MAPASLADPECLSGILFLSIPDPGSLIPEPTTTTEEEGGKVVVIPFFVATNFTKLKMILFLNRYRKKFEQIDREL